MTDLPRAEKALPPESPILRRGLRSPGPRPQSAYFLSSGEVENGARRPSWTMEDVEALAEAGNRRRSVINMLDLPSRSPTQSSIGSSASSGSGPIPPGGFAYNSRAAGPVRRDSTRVTSAWSTLASGLLSPADARSQVSIKTTTSEDLSSKTARIKSTLSDLPRQADQPGGGSGREWFASRHGQRRAPIGSDLESTTALVYQPEIEDYHAVLGLVMAGARNGQPAALSPDSKPYKRVLDVACGPSANWIIEAAQQWPEAQFTGLDASPTLIDKSRLPEAFASRLSFVHSDMLGPWPFEEGAFDLVRLGFLGMAIPEQQLAFVLGEAVRVAAKSTGRVEIVDAAIAPLFDSESATVAAPPSQAAARDDWFASKYWPARFDSSEFGLEDGLYSVRSMHAAVERAQLRTNANTGYHAESALLLKDIVTAGRVDIEEPESASPQARKMTKTSSGSKRSSADLDLPPDDVTTRVIHHAAANYVDALADLNHERYTEHRQRQLTAGASFEFAFPDVSRAQGVAAIQSLSNNRRERAGLAQLLGDRLGWTCTLDEKIEAKLTRNIEDVRRQLKSLSPSATPTRTSTEDVATTSTSTNDGVQKELSDMEKRLESEVQSVRKRLGKGEPLPQLPARGAIELFLLTGVKPETQRW